jgi:5-deoxy-glucuronate isomerase
MQIKHPKEFKRGYEPLVTRSGQTSDMKMDFGHLELKAGDAWASPAGDERAILLALGSVEFSWEDGGGKHVSAKASRSSLFDENPTVLSLPRSAKAEVRAISDSELYLVSTDNLRDFPARLYLPGECFGEERGKGAMRETSTRIVRTTFDDRNATHSNLVIGEVVGVPGRWSSYPPHHHPQPEIYHYRFLPEQGFGLTEIGETAYMLRNRDTILIRDGQDHPQVTAPGYAMWYLWVIRHLEGNRYGTPEFNPDHVWVADPKADIWDLPSERKDASSRPQLPATSASPAALGRKK